MVNMELSDDLLHQIEALSGAPSDEFSSRSAKFDDAGTLHVMYRDGDDKLVHDTPIKTMEIPGSQNSDLKKELEQYESEVHKQTQLLARVFTLFIVALIIAAGVTIYVVQTMG